MPPTDDIEVFRQKLAHADAVIAELRGVVADLRKQVEAQQAHIHRLVKMTFGRGGGRVEGPTLFDGLDPPEVEVTTPVEPPPPNHLPRRSGRGTAGGRSRRICRAAGRRST